MCGSDCGSKHQVMLDTIASLDFKLNEANELLQQYREIAIEHLKIISTQHEFFAKLREERYRCFIPNDNYPFDQKLTELHR